jgi:hypothetical protein
LCAHRRCVIAGRAAAGKGRSGTASRNVVGRLGRLAVPWRAVPGRHGIGGSPDAFGLLLPGTLDPVPRGTRGGSVLVADVSGEGPVR